MVVIEPNTHMLNTKNGIDQVDTVRLQKLSISQLSKETSEMSLAPLFSDVESVLKCRLHSLRLSSLVSPGPRGLLDRGDCLSTAVTDLIFHIRVRVERRTSKARNGRY